MKTTVAERFWQKVDLANPSGCWSWTACSSRGYGMFRSEGTKVYAHRFAYEALVGPIPRGLELDHLCRVPLCVNPLHLEPVTHRENTLRGVGGTNNAAKMECPQGHPYDAANTYRIPGGGRACHSCRRDAVRRYRMRLKEVG